MSLIEDFFEECKHRFVFLENIYSFRLEKEDTVNVNILQDAYAIIIYIGRKMSVVLRWTFFESVIEVIFLELKEEWQYPVISVNSNHLLATYPEAARTIDIYTLATTLGHRDDNVFLLKNVSDSANRQRQMRTRII